MRKVNADVEVEVLLPIKFTLGFLMRQDECASPEREIGRVLAAWARNRSTTSKYTDIEDVSLVSVDLVNGTDEVTEPLSQAIDDVMADEKKKLTIVNVTITDSR